MVTGTTTVPATTELPDPRRVEAVLSWLENSTWTEDAYFALPETNHIVELSAGKLIVHEMPTLAHQRTVRFLFRALDDWNEEHQAGEVLFAAYPVRLAPGLIREPDVLFYSAEHRDRLENQRGGPPDLAMEVVSPGSRHTDLVEKLAEYARAGISEYWIVEPETRWIEVYMLEGTGYTRVARFRAGQVATSKLLPAFTIPVDTLPTAK